MCLYELELDLNYFNVPVLVYFTKMECHPVCRAVLHCYVLDYSVLHCSAKKFIAPLRSVLYSTPPYFNYWLTLRFCTITVRNLLYSTVLQGKCTVMTCTAVLCTFMDYSILLTVLHYSILWCRMHTSVWGEEKLPSPPPALTRQDSFLIVNYVKKNMFSF
jgi:hypothetical protein